MCYSRALPSLGDRGTAQPFSRNGRPLSGVASYSPNVANGNTTTLGYLMGETYMAANGRPEAGSAVEARILDGYGGSAVNFAYHMARLSHPVRCITHAGNDEHGRGMMAELRSVGVDVLPIVRGRSARIVIEVDRNAERSFYVDVRDCMEVRRRDISNEMLNNTDVLFATSYQLFYEPSAKAAGYVLDGAAKRGCFTVLDASSAWEISNYGVDRYREQLDRFRPSILLASRGEADIMGIVTDRPETLPAGVTLAIIHDGGRNAVALSPDLARPISVPAIQVRKVVDTTGAGDAFNAGIVSSLLHRSSTPQELADSIRNPQILRSALRSGHRLAASVVQNLGSRAVPQRIYSELQNRTELRELIG